MTWREEWRPIKPADVIATGVAGLGAAASLRFIDPADPPRWEGGILFDDAGQRTLLAETNSGRETAGTISDFGYLGILFAVPTVDPLVAWLVHDNEFVAKQVLGTYIEAYGFAALFANLLPRVAGRERPPVDNRCLDNPNLEVCEGRSSLSFPSGHAFIAFTGASAMLTQHLFLPLYGGGAGEIAAVSAVSGTAVTTGFLRIVGGKHYSSDVLTAAVLGSAIGFGVPYFLRYRSPFGGRADEQGVRMDLDPMVSRRVTGLEFQLQW